MTRLIPLPDQQETLIVVGTSVRKPLPVLSAYLDSLAWQDVPKGVRFHYCFVSDYPDPNDVALQHLKNWVAERGGEVLMGGPTVVGDFADTHAVTHQWTAEAMQRVGRLKNRVLQRTVELRADYCFFADADLILDKTTIRSLLAARQPIACAVYWTHWQRSPTEELVVHAGPQVWLRHPYQLDGRGYDEPEFRRKLMDRDLIQVWGQGACTLIQRAIIEAGVSFSPAPEVPMTGLMAGEDRHFCIHAERRHIPMYADAWPDIFHIYHLPDDQALIPAMQARLGADHPLSPQVGDLVSLILTPMEGIPQPDGRWNQIPPQPIRGRLGALKLEPELEEAICEMTRGTSRIVPVHFPVSYPLPQFRGTKRLIKVDLVDCKPMGYPPVLERELYVGERAKGRLDATTLTPDQHESIGA